MRDSAAACSREPEARTYQLKGQVLAVDVETREILVKHEDIPGFMPAMTMPYVVKDAALLKDRAPGDLITATLTVESTLASSVGDHQDRLGAATGRRADDDSRGGRRRGS